MLTSVIVAAAVFGVAKVARDWLVLRQVRAAMEAGTPEDRVRIGLRLAEALGGGQAPAAPEQAPEPPGGEAVTPRR
ncbi:hypothetical protein [Streptomyces sp. NPDC090112]|uniref:hypothetical protein n=1 Tax=Streptomyces sp. NPDC090112 TaxID=3365949 RepID=UPI0037F66231